MTEPESVALMWGGMDNGSALAHLLPALEAGEIVEPQRLRIEGNTVLLPIHVFSPSGNATRVEARFPVDGADETIMRSAIARAIETARERL